jgi:hypothetical protein
MTGLEFTDKKLDGSFEQLQISIDSAQRSLEAAEKTTTQMKSLLGAATKVAAVGLTSMLLDGLFEQLQISIDSAQESLEAAEKTIAQMKSKPVAATKVAAVGLTSVEGLTPMATVAKMWTANELLDKFGQPGVHLPADTYQIETGSITINLKSNDKSLVDVIFVALGDLLNIVASATAIPRDISTKDGVMFTKDSLEVFVNAIKFKDSLKEIKKKSTTSTNKKKQETMNADARLVMIRSEFDSLISDIDKKLAAMREIISEV